MNSCVILGLTGMIIKIYNIQMNNYSKSDFLNKNYLLLKNYNYILSHISDMCFET